MIQKIVVSEETGCLLGLYINEHESNFVCSMYDFIGSELSRYSLTMTNQLKELGLTLTELATIFETGEYEVEKKCPFEVGDLVKFESTVRKKIEVLKVAKIEGSTLWFTDGLCVEWALSNVTLVCKASEDKVSKY